MKFSTANIKHAGYQEENHVIYVGTQAGSFKRVDTFNEENPYKQTNFQSLAKLTRDSKVTALSWADEDKNEILLGRGDSVIRTFDCSTNSFCQTELKIPQGKVVGLAWCHESIVAASDDGKLHILNDSSTVIETGDDISRMRQCPKNRNLIAVGGKDRKNNLKVYDMEAQKEIFTSKNVPLDNLQLEVPVWDSDMAFVNDSENCLATCSRHGYIRFYDYRQQRRPIHNYSDNRDQAFNSMATHGGIVYVGTNTGSLYAFDLKSLKVPLHTYKGAVGGISSISTVDETGKFLAASSLDRYVRVYDAEKTHLLYQCYMKSKPSEILVKPADQRLLDEQKSALLEAQKRAAEGSDEEFDNLFTKMQKVEDDGKSEEKKAKLQKSEMKRHSGIVFRT